MPEIRLRHDGRRIIMPVTLIPAWPPNRIEGLNTHALLDTGATTTGITPRVVRQLGLNTMGKKPLGSARGDELADRFMLRVGLAVEADAEANPRFPFIFEEKMVFELKDSFHLDALIGMDILSECDFTMTRQGECSLRFG